jgi:SAM-dependent methyltransferase
MCNCTRVDRRKRALTQQRTPATIDLFGDRSIAERLGRALDVAGVGDEPQREYTHGFHTYPARMHPLTARRALVVAGAKVGSVVLDPFCGSGTVLVEAMRAGAKAIGVDASPLALLIARTRLGVRTARERKELVERARRIGALVIAEGKAARRAGYEPPPERTARGVSKTSRQEALAGWFDPHVRRELETIAELVAKDGDEALTAVLSSILIKVSRRESDTSEKKVTRRIGRSLPARFFVARTEELVQGLDALSSTIPAGTPAAEVREGDARSLVGIANASIDCVVTSPPYAGTFDYTAHHALRLAFLGMKAGKHDAAEIGARRGFSGDRGNVERALAQWDRDLGRVLGEISRALKKGGRAILLTGDSLAGERAVAEPVWSDDVIGRLAPAAGLTIVAAASQQRTPLGAAERAAFETRPKREHLVLLERS